MKAIIPGEMASMEAEWRMSPGIAAGGLLFLTGFSGASSEGGVAEDAAAQIDTAFDQAETVLTEAGGDLGDVVEVTSFHVGLANHLDIFRAAWARRMSRPYPAWTAIEVAGFATAGVIVELRVVVREPKK